MKNKKYDIIIIGSGPAGLTAAKITAESGKSVLVLERNDKTSKKIYATGNGRCNFLNTNMDGAEEVLAYCNSIGIIEAKEEAGRLYPRNYQASSVAKILNHAAACSGAEIITNALVTGVSFNAGKFNVAVQINEHNADVKSESVSDFVCAEKVLVATGGKAGIQYGCYGDGYRWAQGFGHTIVKPIPALTGLECTEDISTLHGVRLNAKAGLFCNDDLVSSDTGEVQFTKDGISGICVMNLSRYLRLAEEKKYILRLDMYPEYSKEELPELFRRQISAAGCAMECLVPEKMHDYLHTRIKPSEHNPFTMAKLSKALDFTIIGSKGWKIAQVTSGGISMDEVSENYESKLISGLFFAGEILDYDGPCGGYNIGFAIRSGLKAGIEMSR